MENKSLGKNDIAKILDQAAMHAQAIPQLDLEKSFNEDDAYEIQKLSIDERLNRGERMIGMKLGFTSYAKMEQMGVHDMIWGRLTSSMLYKAGEQLPMSQFIHPRAEPEICFLIKKDIDREFGLDEVKDYIEAVAPAIEIIDSRYENFKFSLEDVIADNCSSTAFVVGAWQNINQDIDDLKMELIIDGETVESGTSKAILANPWLSATNASRLAIKYGMQLKAGDYLMAGAATGAVYIKEGQSVKCRVERLGDVGLGTK